DTQPAAFRETPADEPLVVRPLEEPGCESAGERLLQVALLFRADDERPAGGRGGDRVAGGARGRGDVGRALQPALELEADYPGVDQVADELVPGQVLRAEQVRPVAEVADLAVNNHLVREPAGLGALPAIRAAAAEGLARQALAGVGDTQRPMDEHLDRD